MRRNFVSQQVVRQENEFPPYDEIVLRLNLGRMSPNVWRKPRIAHQGNELVEKLVFVNSCPCHDITKYLEKFTLGMVGLVIKVWMRRGVAALNTQQEGVVLIFCCLGFAVGRRVGQGI